MTVVLSSRNTVMHAHTHTHTEYTCNHVRSQSTRNSPVFIPVFGTSHFLRIWTRFV